MPVRSTRARAKLAALVTTSLALLVALVSPCAALAAERRIEGQLLGPEGPAEGVPLVAAWLGVDDEPLIVEGASGPGGLFSLRLPAPSESHGSLAGRLVVAALFEGAPAALAARDAREGDWVGLQLEPAARAALDARTLDDEGRPLEGVRVRAWPAALGDAPAGDGPLALLLEESASGPGGRVRLEGLPAGELVVIASAPGRARDLERVALLAVSEREPIELVLPPGGEVRGRVLDPKGAPLAGARVALMAERTFGRGARSYGEFDALSDEEGRFRFEGVPSEVELIARATHEDFLPARSGSLRAPIDDVTLRLGEGARLRVRLVDAEGQPYAGALRVAGERRGEDAEGGRFVSRWPLRLAPFRSEGEGLYLVEPLLPGSYLLRLMPEGFAPLEEEVLLEAGQTRDLGTRSLPGSTLVAGVVHDLSGAPLVGAEILVRPEGGFGRPALGARSMRTTSDAEGRFVIRGEGPLPRALALEASAEGFVRLEMRELGAEAARSLRLELAPEATLSGVVALAGEPPRPLAAFRVEATRERDAESAAGGLIDRRSLRQLAGATRSAGAGPGGRFELRGLEAGRYLVTLGAPGLLERTLPTVELQAGERRELGTLTLERGATLEGFVVARESGAALAGASVSREATGGPMSFMAPAAAEAKSDVSGRFVMRGLPPGPLGLMVDHEDYAPERVVVNVEAGFDPAPLRVALGPGATLEGRVLDDAGQAVEGAFVVLLPSAEGGSPRSTQTDELGFYRLENVPPGERSVFVRQPGRGPAGAAGGRSVTLVEGETARLDFPADDEAALRVRGRVLRDEEPLAARLFFSLEGRRGPAALAASAESDASGAFEVALPSAGAYTVTVLERIEGGPQVGFGRGGTRGASSRLPVRVGADVGELLLEVPTTRVEGRVLAAESARPIEGARVFALRLPGEDDAGEASGGSVSFADASESDEAGLYAFEGLVPATYTIVAIAPERAYARVDELTLPDADDTRDDVDLRLARATPLAVQVRRASGGVAEGALVAPFFEEELEGLGFLMGSLVGADGRAFLKTLPEGVYELVVAARGYAPALVEGVQVAPDAPPPDVVVLAPAGTLVVRAYGEGDERPLAGARVRLVDLATKRDMARLAAGGLRPGRIGDDPRTGDDGALTLSSVGAGRFRVEVLAADGREASTTLTMSAGEEREVSLTLR